MLLLYAVGTGAVRGFALTISLGIITSMFTATVVTRLLMVMWLKKNRPKVLSVTTGFRLAPDDTRIRFMRGKRLGLIFSVLLSLASIGLFIKPGLNYGVDFAGGIVMEIRTPEPALPRKRVPEISSPMTLPCLLTVLPFRICGAPTAPGGGCSSPSGS